MLLLLLELPKPNNENSLPISQQLNMNAYYLVCHSPSRILYFNNKANFFLFELFIESKTWN